jgi:hypothetical protein
MKVKRNDNKARKRHDEFAGLCRLAELAVDVFQTG